MKTTPLLINDPVYGFTQIPRGLLTDIVAHPYFQRLGRIRQLGMSGLVFPGAQHTRQQHSIGAFHLMQEALRTLREKGVFIFESEVEAAEAAILLHDVGHGPFSHVLERVLMPDVSHEEISLQMMHRMNEEFDGRLSLAIKIFKDEYHKPFLHELCSSQLDVDRLDYLCRDSFFAGVREGNIGAARIIKMLEVADDRLLINEKGMLSVENYLMSRRVMYWQVYLHKTVVAADEVLRQTLRRAKFLASRGVELFCAPALHYFLYGETDSSWLDMFAHLEDNDILSAVKEWQNADDRILSILASDFMKRRLFKVDVYAEEVPAERVDDYRKEISVALDVDYEDTDYFVQTQRVAKEMYSATSEGIGILQADGTVRDVSELSHIVRGESTTSADSKFYLLHQRL